MATPVIKSSFTAGEVSPGLYGRVDLTKYAAGAAQLKNWYIDPAGGVSNRPGTAYVGRTKQGSNLGGADSCALTGVPAPRLIPFTFSTIQTYMLEFGNEYMRVVKAGGYVLETAFNIAAISNASPGILQTTTTNSFTNSDWVFVQGAEGMTQVNGRVFMVDSASTDSFSLTDVDGNGISTVTYGAYTTGGTVARIYTLATPYVSSDLATLKYTQSADVLTITHPNYAPADLTRTGDAAWTLTDITFQPGITPPTTVSAVASAAGAYTYRYEVTAINADGTEESRASTSTTVTSAQMSQVTGRNIKISWTPVAAASAYNIYRQPEVTNSPDLGMLYGFCGSTTGVNFTDQNILPDFTRTPPQARNPFANSPILYIIVDSGGSGFTSGTTATVSDSSGSGWTGFLEIASGALVAVITQYGGQDYSSPTISFSGGATATCSFVLGPATGNYPSCVTYFQQRKVFAGSLNNPETMWFTQIGNFKNMDVSTPTRDSDAITVTLASLQVNIIEWMVPMTSGLIIGTRSGAWQVSGGQFLEPITPTQIVAQPQAFNGASYVQPLPVNYDVLFIQNLQDIVRDLSYNFYVNIYTGTDLTVISKHLFQGFQILDWCYQDEPFKLVWAIRNDGELLSMTFLKEQEEWGWTHHDTQGSWRAVGTIIEGEENVLYLIAERTIPGINGGNPMYYLERMASRNMNTAWNNYNADVTVAWFLDCAAQYPLITPAFCLDRGEGIVTATGGSYGSGPFSDPGSVGSIIRMAGGILTVSTVSSNTVAFTNTMVDPEGGMHATTGAWTLTAPVTVVTGLWHLEGATVYALSNGSVEGPFTVLNGSITLTVASDIITVGLLIEDVRAKTLYLDVGNPTIQGKRKTIPGVTLRMWNSRELMLGPPGGPYAPQKLRTNEPLGQPTRLVTGDVRTNIQSQWRTEGQVEWFMPYPLPATVTAVIDEVSVGDSGG